VSGSDLVEAAPGDVDEVLAFWDRLDARRRGGARLRAAGCRRISVLRDEEAAAGLWRSAGFRYDERIHRYVKPPSR
jgi:hypothetical protein